MLLTFINSTNKSTFTNSGITVKFPTSGYFKTHSCFVDRAMVDNFCHGAYCFLGIIKP